MGQSAKGPFWFIAAAWTPYKLPSTGVDGALSILRNWIDPSYFEMSVLFIEIRSSISTPLDRCGEKEFVILVIFMYSSVTKQDHIRFCDSIEIGNSAHLLFCEWIQHHYWVFILIYWVPICLNGTSPINNVRIVNRALFHRIHWGVYRISMQRTILL